MTKDKEALLIIDYTNDFVHSKGSLTAGKPARELENPIVELADAFVDAGNFVILPTDVHKKDDPYHPETKLFPPHNLRNTWGRELYGKVNDWYNENKDLDNVWQMDKTRYSSFVGTDLDLMLRERNVKTVHLGGVATEICVLHTGISAYNLAYNVVVHKNGIAPLSEKGSDFAMEHFKNALGATILN